MMCMFIRCFYWMRFFDHTAHYVRLILDAMNEIKYFFVLFVIVLITFGLPIFVFSMDSYGVDSDDQLIIKAIPESRFLNTVIHMYMLALGEFETMTQYRGENPRRIWGLFVVSTFVVQITFLNVLIAIMGDVYQKVMSNRKQARLREKMQIYADYVDYLDDKNFTEKNLIVMNTIEEDNIDKLGN
jgi:hypothetical protein